jgi:hypothetical protein
MFYHRISFFSQIRIWTIAERAQLLLLERLQVHVRCANPSIWYSLTHKLVSTLLEHTSRVVLHVFALQSESSLQLISKSSSSKIRCISDKTLKKSDWKAYPKVASDCPFSGPIRHVGCKSVVIPASGRRDGVIALSDHVRVVHTDKVI